MSAKAASRSRPEESEIAQVQNNSQSRGHVVVVGCGIAGAAAANRLHRKGFEVTVLEAEQRIGGRTSTRHQDGFKIDLAASMLFTSYKRTVELIAEQHWESHLEPAGDVIGVERGGRVHHIRASKPLGVLTTGLLSPRAKTRLGVVAQDVVKRDLERFKSLTPPASRVCFAGDAMSSSTINSCLCTGERAADKVITAIAE